MSPLRALLTFLLVLGAPAALMAEDPFPPYILTVPTSPDSDDAVRVVTWVECPESGIPTVTRSGREVRIHFERHPFRGCIALRLPWRTEVAIGTLDPGEWTISVSGFAKSPFSRTIHVRGVSPIPVYPPGLPTTGGKVRLGKAPLFLDRPRVFFGEAEGRVITRFDATLEVEAPAHPPGVVDLKVILENGETFITPHAFKYYEPTGTPDPWVFEPLLFPAAYDGPGAAGAAWRSENAIAPLRASAVLFEPPCGGCPTEIFNRVRIEAPSRAEGLVLFAAREASESVTASSRMWDDARQPGSAGTAVPVVRLDEFRHRLGFPNVPVRAGSRALLRVWGALPTEEVSVRLRSSERTEFTRMSLFRTPNGLAFNTLPLDHWMRMFAEGDFVALEISGESGPFWAMVTVTDNETHHVTALTPR